VGTGNDDVRDDSSVTAYIQGASNKCLKPSSKNLTDTTCPNGLSYNQGYFPCRNPDVDGHNDWPNWTECTVTGAQLQGNLTSAADFSTITVSLIEADPGCGLFCDNWNLQKLVVTVYNSRGLLPRLTLLDISQPQNRSVANNCIARLRARSEGNVTFKLDGTNSPGTYDDGSRADKYCDK
jgi:hypothetical protein